MGTIIVYSFAIVVVCALLRVVSSFWWRPKSLEKQLKQQGIRGTSYKLVWGDAKAFKQSSMEAMSKPMPLKHSITSRVSPFYLEMTQKYGKVSLSWFFTRPRVIIMEPELIRLILTNKNGHFGRSPGNPLGETLTRGLTFLEGEEWAKRRKLLTPAFHLQKLRGMAPAFSASCLSMVERWKSLVGPGGGTYELDVMHEFQNLTADVISRTAFGSSYEEGKKLFELQNEQAVLALEAFRTLYFPGYRFVPTRKNTRRYHVDKEIKVVIKKIILKKKLALKNGDSGNDDLLGLLLQCQEQADNGLTIEDVIEECKLFYLAGQETTAVLLTWTIILLSMHPNWQDKARDEVLQICGKNIPDIEAISHLKIVSMILHEVLRLYPSVIQLMRHTRERTNVGGMCLPAGIDILLPIILLHHSPEYWGDDVEEFNPERFSEGVSKASKSDQMALYPFGWGPRICLGQGFALMEAKMALAMILQQFGFELSPNYIHAPHSVFTLRPQHGAPIRVFPI